MTLEERIRQLEERNAELEKRLADKDSRIADLDRKIVSKDNRIAYLEQQLYGSRSEKRLSINPDALQLSLFSTEIDAQEQQRLDAAIAKDEERREKLLKVDGYERKVCKPIDTSKLEVREEHIYPDGINPDDYNEVEPLITESLVLVPQKMYIRRIVRHKYVLKTSLQQTDPERQVFEVATSLLLLSTSAWRQSPFLQTSWFRSSYITFRSTESYRNIARWESRSVTQHWEDGMRQYAKS